MRVLKMEFSVVGSTSKSVTLTVKDPKEDVTLAMVKEVVPYITAVIEHASGYELSTLTRAYFETVTTEDLE